MRSRGAAEAGRMDDSGGAKKPARQRAATSKSRAPRKRPAAAVVVEPPVVAEAAPTRRSRRLLAAASVLVLAAGAAAGTLLVLRGSDTRPPDVRAGVPVLVSAGELAAHADAGGVPVYWAGALDGRRLELTTTSAGTFVRYLPSGVAAGDDDRALTIATYPLATAFATATARARSAQMASERTQSGGLAVWNRGRPTSVYLAFRGVRQLIEIYSPDAGEARRIARSGEIVPVR
jgi:hypothetical protein